MRNKITRADPLPEQRRPIDHSRANRLLAKLDADDRRQLLADASLVELTTAQVLGQAGQRLEHAYFPTTSLISMQSSGSDAHRMSVGMIGFGGMLGAGCVLGVRSLVFDAVVSGAGLAWRIDATKLARHGRHMERLTQLLSRFLFVELSQIGTLASCGRAHSLSQRLSRCLLMAQDRSRTADLYLTHQALAEILGVRRAGISVTASELQSLQLIRYTRGHIVVTDQAGLLKHACSCYQRDLQNYQRIMR